MGEVNFFLNLVFLKNNQLEMISITKRHILEFQILLPLGSHWLECYKNKSLQKFFHDHNLNKIQVRKEEKRSKETTQTKSEEIGKPWPLVRGRGKGLLAPSILFLTQKETHPPCKQPTRGLEGGI